jgi:hypothetical protein
MDFDFNGRPKNYTSYQLYLTPLQIDFMLSAIDAAQDQSPDMLALRKKLINIKVAARKDRERLEKLNKGIVTTKGVK